MSDVPHTKTHQSPGSLVALQDQDRAETGASGSHRPGDVEPKKHRISLCEPPRIANRVHDERLNFL